MSCRRPASRASSTRHEGAPCAWRCAPRARPPCTSDARGARRDRRPRARGRQPRAAAPTGRALPQGRGADRAPGRPAGTPARGSCPHSSPGRGPRRRRAGARCGRPHTGGTGDPGGQRDLDAAHARAHRHAEENGLGHGGRVVLTRPGSRSANSSPPRRKASPFWRRRRAMCASTRSPTGWPWRSLMSLKLSMSRRQSDRIVRPRRPLRDRSAGAPESSGGCRGR